MENFDYYLQKTQEVGFVEKVLQTLVYVSGIPSVKPNEVVIFETGDLGLVTSLAKDEVEVLLLTNSNVEVGTKLTRKDEELTVPLSDELLGQAVDSLGVPVDRPLSKEKQIEFRPIDSPPPPISLRKNIDSFFETGVVKVDLIVPLGKGQRQLVVGDRKTGKTSFLLQTACSAASQGIICIYAAIAKKSSDIKLIDEFLQSKKIKSKTVLVVSHSGDAPGKIFLTPYTAMTLAEYFKDMGNDVLVILDDMTAHAKYYREISLLARRFPGRSSYPGDIFYVHAKLMERAGNFLLPVDKKGNAAKTVSITALPVSELVLGDLSGYIQTNLMAMTDGHIFFDIDLYNQGKRPPVNPFLSVTRVGRQAQSPLFRDINRELTSFLVKLEDLKRFMHFGAELGEKTRKSLALGERVSIILDQKPDEIVPVNISVILLAAVWSGYWAGRGESEIKKEVQQLIGAYNSDQSYREKVSSSLANLTNFSDLVAFLKKNSELLLGFGTAKV